MHPKPSRHHVLGLIQDLRLAAQTNQMRAIVREDGGLGLCLGAALANDAADALEALLPEQAVNEDVQQAKRGS